MIRLPGDPDSGAVAAPSGVGLETDVPILPVELVVTLLKSVEEFKGRFGALSMMAEANGWIRDYSDELHRVARVFFAAGELQAMKKCQAELIALRERFDQTALESAKAAVDPVS